MSLDKGIVEEVTRKFQLHSKDTGSADVQVAILHLRVLELSDHMTTNPKDVQSRLNLLKLVGQRRKLLEYLKQTDTVRYTRLLEKLGLKK